ncbi:hypothetical protein AJ80_01588 [Polytolypa hystricis UAMH7299]|uniref:Pre-mRNA-splicing factor 38B n=1 Tax=Polytolypa hystricis (strain UAMH7299) TaxID=1447883 RepID=A0A2B7Z091_POLH7|nr:hypothetical protein AJ80_01588 [Polytolypa hystricis UAMH7299]
MSSRKPTKPADNDAYVAKLLADDARKCSTKYSTVGMNAFMPKRPTSAAPKPNTRFLRNIIRETDSHNANLKKKEEEEARERMKQLRAGRTPGSRSEDRRYDDGRESKRRRVEGPLRDRRGDRDREGSKRSRTYDDRHSPDHAKEKISRRDKRKHDSDESELEKYDRPSRGRRHDGGERGSRSSHRRHPEDHDLHSRTHRSDDHERHPKRNHDHKRSRHSSRSRSTSRSRLPSHRSSRRKDEDKAHHSRHLDKQRTSASPAPEVSTNNREISMRRSSTSYSRQNGGDDGHHSSSDSDPLSNLVGPPLPSTSDMLSSTVRMRGRGAHKAPNSTIDQHFASSYNPALDVHLDNDDDEQAPTKRSRRPVPGLATEDDDDWDMALEALRDRTLWRRQGADRLRAAGFDDKVVDRWVNNAAFRGMDKGGGAAVEKDVQDVKWAKKGEGREWDRGKVVDDHGHISLRAEWSQTHDTTP